MKFCAFLRGVNVKGTTMKMSEVCSVFDNEGMKNVSSVLATGNILFSSDDDSDQLKLQLESVMSKHFDYEAFMFIKSAEEIEDIILQNPFEKTSANHIYVFVTSVGMEEILMDEFLNANISESEKAAIVNRTFYWQVQKGNTLDSEFGKILGKKALKDKITSRNFNTLEKITTKLKGI